MYTTKKNFAFNPDKKLQELKPALFADEEVLALFVCGNGYGLISSMRVALFKVGKLNPHVSVTLDQASSLEAAPGISSNTYSLKLVDGSKTVLGQVLRADESAIAEVFEAAKAQYQSSGDGQINTPESRAAEFSAIDTNLPWTKVPEHLRKNVMANVSEGEKPLFIISTSVGTIAGAIVALDDRCMIIKSGVLGGLMAGSLGGARVSSFYYREITGVEYNSGFFNGVFEILTASYSGSANKDYWRGNGKNPNSDLNNPWALSNTLPISKVDYEGAKKQFDKFRALISATKGATGVVSSAPPLSLADELEKLSSLLQKGVIDEDEFKEAKKKLLQSGA